MNRIGIAEEAVAGDVMRENLQSEKLLTVASVDEQMQRWLLTKEGMAANAELIASKRNALLMIDSGKIGITISADGARQKRTIGKGLTHSSFGWEECEHAHYVQHKVGCQQLRQPLKRQAVSQSSCAFFCYYPDSSLNLRDMLICAG